jgi:hypothetical protein
VQKITIKTCDFIDIGNTAIPTALGGSTTTSPPIVVVILRQQLDYFRVYAAPEKAKFSSSKSRLLFTFAAPDARGLRHEKSSCVSLTSKNCESPSSWRFLSNTCQFSLQSHKARLTIGKAQNLGRQANEKA